MSGSGESREWFDTLCDSVKGIPMEARSLFRELVEEDLIDPNELRSEAVAYVERFEKLSGENEFLDPDEARCIRDLFLALLDAVTSETSEDEQRLIQAGVRYFIIEDDGDSDRRIGGLDDDLAVANAVARCIGRADLVIE